MTVNEQIYNLAKGLDTPQLQAAAEWLQKLLLERREAEHKARVARMVALTPEQAADHYRATWVRLDLRPDPELARKYGPAIRVAGGRYSHARGHASTRYIDLPLTDEAIKLGNKLWLEFYKRNSKNGGVMVFDVAGQPSLQAYHTVRYIEKVEDAIQTGLEQLKADISRGVAEGRWTVKVDPLGKAA